MAMFDLEKTSEVEALLGVEPQRDAGWQERFYAAAGDASMAAGDPQVIVGPDGFPYFSLHPPPIAEPFETYCINHLLAYCTGGGFGCVLHDRQGGTGWVFTYGNLWSQRALGTFDAASPDDPRTPQTLEAPENVLVGAPSEELLPPWARQVLRNALQQLGVAEPQVALVARAAGYPKQALALTSPTDPAAAHRLTWYLPPHLGMLEAAAVDAGALAPL